MRVLVLGCGPSGLLAAHAAQRHGHDVIIVSRRRKSEMYGCQYLHTDIPDLGLNAPTEVLYELRGKAWEYREKVYGKEATHTVSPEDLSEDHMAWDLRDAYTTLWKMFGREVVDQTLDSRSFGPGSALSVGTGEADVVISTLPAPLLCQRPDQHFFETQEVYAVGDAPERGVFAPDCGLDPDTVVCNGHENPRWYRAANVHGYMSVEWPNAEQAPPVKGVTKIKKPIRTTCNCLPHITRLGRYGKWQKGILTSDVFAEADQLLDPSCRLF